MSTIEIFAAAFVFLVIVIMTTLAIFRVIIDDHIHEIHEKIFHIKFDIALRLDKLESDHRSLGRILDDRLKALKDFLIRYTDEAYGYVSRDLEFIDREIEELDGKVKQLLAKKSNGRHK